MFNFIAKPFGILLMWLYEFTGNYGVAVILFALIVKLILLPFQMKGKRGMMQTTRLQPRIKELEKKHGANKAKFNAEVSKLYKEEKINPMSGCIWSLIPFPILIALYQAIRQPLTIMMGIAAEHLADGGIIANKLSELGFSTTLNAAYSQIAKTEFISQNFDKFEGLVDGLKQIDYRFLGLNLGTQPRWNFLWKTDWSDPSVWLPGLGLFLIPILAGVLTYLSSKISTKMSGQEQQGSMSTMLIFMPLFTMYITFIMPAALGIYWIASSFFAIIQDIILTKYYTKVMDAEDAERIERERAKEAELEAKRKETERLKAENATVQNPNTSKRKRQITERQEQLSRSAEWEKKHKPSGDGEDEPSRIGSRRYALGRAYDPDRYTTLTASEAEEQADGEEPAAEPSEDNHKAPESSISLPSDTFDEENEEPEYEDDDASYDDEEELTEED